MKRFCCETWPRSHGRIWANVARRLAFVERLVFRTTEGLRVAAFGLILFLDILRCLLDKAQRLFVAKLVVILPRDEAVLAHHDRAHARIFPNDLLHRETQLKPGRIQGT